MFLVIVLIVIMSWGRGLKIKIGDIITNTIDLSNSMHKFPIGTVFEIIEIDNFYHLKSDSGRELIVIGLRHFEEVKAKGQKKLFLN